MTPRSENVTGDAASPRLVALRWAAIALWLAAIVRLMIADVWDETNGMVAFSDPAHTLGWKIHFVLTQSLGFYRPLPSAFAAAVLHVAPDYSVSWRLLRLVNAGMLVAAAVLFANALAVWNGRSEKRDLLFTIGFLFSGSAIITAGWYANIFDASSLLLVAAGTVLLAREQPIEAGVLFGVAFFCKETAVLSLPFLVILWACGRTSFRSMFRAGVPAAVLGAIYFAIRGRIIPFGSASDTHGFQPDLFLPTLLNLCESFWRQTLKGDGRGVIGFLFFALSLVALRRIRVIAAAALLLLGSAVIYWGMVSKFQGDVLITHFDFIGRLYLMPVALLLFILLLERQTAAVVLLLIPILFGGVTTYRDHARFQQTYKRIYKTAAQSPTKPFTVDYAEKPLHDPVRGIEIGAFPTAAVKIDPRSGRLEFR